MSLKKIQLTNNDDIFIYENDDYGCGYINNDGHLYLIDKPNSVAHMLPDEYKNTPILLYPACGGYNDGLIMVSTLGEVELQYHHNFGSVAGMWGWLDTDGKVVIEPQFVYAMQFVDGMALVCKGEWQIDENERYWCKNEQWGIINQKCEEIVPCKFDEIFYIDNSDRFILCHSGGWKNGYQCIYDVENQKELVRLDFDFDCAYMFNERFYSDGNIILCEHHAGEEKDLLYAYSVDEEKWLVYKEECVGREFNGETKKVALLPDGKEVIIF